MYTFFYIQQNYFTVCGAAEVFLFDDGVCVAEKSIFAVVRTEQTMSSAENEEKKNQPAICRY